MNLIWIERESEWVDCVVACLLFCGALAAVPAHNPQKTKQSINPTNNARGQPNSNSILALISAGLNGIGVVGHSHLPRGVGPLGAALHSFRKREVAAINQLFHSIPKIDLICLLSSFIHLRSQTNHTLGCLSSFLASCLWRAAPITNRKEKTIGPAKTAIPRSIPKLMELIFMGSLCPLNHLYHLIQPMLSLPFNHLYCIKY